MPPLAVSATPNPFNPYGVVTKPATPAAPPPDTRTPEEKFNDAYWAHYPPAVQALRDMLQGTEREQAAATLAKAGYVIDVPIQAWGWDPWKTMKLRQEYGMQFVPSALMTTSGPLDREVPGALRVSLSAADFPPHGGGTVKS